MRLQSLSGLTAFAIATILPLFAANAATNGLKLESHPPFSIQDSIMLAQADAERNGTATYSETDPRISKQKRWLSGERVHKYLGFGSLLFAGAAGLSRPESEGNVRASSSKVNLHRALGITAAALGGAAIANGFYVHGDDFNLKNGWTDPDNLHVLLTIAGTLAYTAALATNGKGMHAAAGIGGFALMETGVLFEW